MYICYTPGVVYKDTVPGTGEYELSGDRWEPPAENIWPTAYEAILWMTRTPSSERRSS